MLETTIAERRRKTAGDRDGIFYRKRDGSFYISYLDHAGKQCQRKLKGVHSLTMARQLRAQQLAHVEKARVLGYTPPTTDSFDDVVPRYLRYQRARLTARAYERTRGIVEARLGPAFGNLRIASIRRVDVERYLTKRMAEVSDGTVIREFNVLKHLLKLATDWELIPRNPAQGVKPPKTPAGRVRYLQPTELHAVLAACPGWLRPIAGLLAFTGMRRSEVLGLRWLDVDLKNGRILLPQTKNGEGRIVWLNTLASDVLNSLDTGSPTDPVFSSNITPENVSLQFLRACRKVGISDFRLHDLRHTAASWLRMKGADLQDVAEVLGHKDLRMTKRYAHLSEAHMEATVKRLDSVFALPAGVGS